jgi:hypothetical protein
LAVAQKAGKDTTAILAKMAEEQGKLTKNIAIDLASKGKASKAAA